VTSELRQVRDEDSFDVERLHGWLEIHAPEVTAGAGLPRVRQFSGGASNLTFLLTYGDQEYVLRRPPRGHKATSAHDMHREVTVQQRLRPIYPLVPNVHAYCADPSIIGEEFYVMSRVRGVILRRDLPPDMSLSPDDARALAFTVIDAQADLHSIDPADVDLADLGRGPGYVARQVSGWSRRYLDARTDDVPDGQFVMQWLAAKQPRDCGQRLIHGDWRLDNLVLDLDGPPRITGVLDWEMATIGDPLMDVGASLAYWITDEDDDAYQLMRRQPTNLPGFPSRAEYMSRYLERTGLDIEDWRFYEVYGLFRLAVIAQQIWYRYRRGETTNPAFSGFGIGVTMLMDRAERLLAG
jgi:aminoglycoside phosphotransferase (APT) family kinase protein